MTYEALDSITRRWLKGDVVDDERTLIVGYNYIDVTTLSRVYLGTAAIHFNRVVLLNQKMKFPAEDMSKAIGDIAQSEGFRTISVTTRKINELRACLQFRSHLNNGVRFRQLLGQHTDLFPRVDHPLKVINRARTLNAFAYNGEMTHVLCESASNKNIVDGDILLKQFFRSADDALLALMKIDGNPNYKLMEIGG